VTNRASLTAEYMALFRALESSRGKRSRWFHDPFAAAFLHESRRWMYEVGRFAPGRWLIERLLDHYAPGVRAAGIARTKWIDEQANEALRTATQLVLLGAGFDTRAYRLPSASRVVAFEIDHPQTAPAKQAALRRSLGALPENVRFVSIDFNTQSLGEVLLRAGYNQAQASCLVWEGVTNYLTAEAVDSTLREIRQTCPGSILLFTYIDRAVLDRPDQFLGAAKLMERLRAYGEPWTFGFRPEELEAYLATRGFQLTADLGVSEVWQRGGRSAAGTHGYEFYRLASARTTG